jgi:hypothetical protein
MGWKNKVMWHYLKNFFIGKHSPDPIKPARLWLSEEGIHYSESWYEREFSPQLWRWPLICEFGLRVGEAIYPDPWGGNYLETEWFLTVMEDGRPHRVLFEVELLSPKKLPDMLIEKLPGLSVDNLMLGWTEHLKGDKNFDGVGEWLGWTRQGFS